VEFSPLGPLPDGLECLFDAARYTTVFIIDYMLMTLFIVAMVVHHVNRTVTFYFLFGVKGKSRVSALRNTLSRKKREGEGSDGEGGVQRD
jgi:hypothetical protein